MSSQDFSKSNCPKCQAAVWAGLGYSLIPIRLEPTRLNLKEEIIEKLKGGRTYEAHRTAKSFEVTPRSMGYIGKDKPHPVVLAQHKCREFVMFGEVAGDPWGRDEKKFKNDSMEVPF